jgi:hypothetical protein
VGKLEALEAIAAFSFFTDNIENRVDQLSAFGVVTFSPIITSARLAKYKVIRAEDLANRSSTDGIHGTGLKIEENGTWDVATATCFVKVHIHALKLQVKISIVSSGGINAVFVADYLKKKKTEKESNIRLGCSAGEEIIQDAVDVGTRMQPTSQNLAPIWLLHREERKERGFSVSGAKVANRTN